MRGWFDGFGRRAPAHPELVLLVSSDDAYLRRLEKQLQRLGFFRVKACRQEAVLKGAVEERVDVIFLDWRPGQNRRARIIQQLQAHEHTTRAPIMLAITANDEPVFGAWQAGVTFMFPPDADDRFVMRMLSYARQERSGSQSESRSAATLLLVGSDQRRLRPVEKSLQRLGHEVVGSAPPETALDAGVDACIDVVLIDWPVSRAEGTEILTRLRADDRTASALLVAMVTRLDRRVLDAEEAGIDELLALPLHDEELRAYVERWLARRDDHKEAG
jgi:PleD family two-component response regulator